MLPINDPYGAKDTHRFKVRGWKKILLANRNDKKLEVAILISDKIDFKTNVIKIDKGHYMRIKKKSGSTMNLWTEELILHQNAFVF